MPFIESTQKETNMLNMRVMMNSTMNQQILNENLSFKN